MNELPDKSDDQDEDMEENWELHLARLERDRAEAEEEPPGGGDESQERMNPFVFWSTALKVMAWIWWVLGSIRLILLVVNYAKLHRWDEGSPGTMVAHNILGSAFILALGGMLLYAFSYVIVGIHRIGENTAPVTEALPLADEAEDGHG